MAIDYISMVSGFLNITLWVIVALVIGVVAFFVWQVTQYKVKVIIRQMTRGRTIIKYDKARIIKDKTGVVWWKFYRAKAKVAEPSSVCIDIDRKGKMFCEFYQIDSQTYVPARDVVTEDDLTTGKFKLFEPLTTQQRALYTHELEVSESYKKMSKAQLFMYAAPLAAMIIIIAIFLLFFGEAVQPIINIGDKYVDDYNVLTERVGVLEKQLNPSLPGETEIPVSDGGVPN